MAPPPHPVAQRVGRDPSQIGTSHAWCSGGDFVPEFCRVAQSIDRPIERPQPPSRRISPRERRSQPPPRSEFGRKSLRSALAKRIQPAKAAARRATETPAVGHGFGNLSKSDAEGPRACAFRPTGRSRRKPTAADPSSFACTQSWRQWSRTIRRVASGSRSPRSGTLHAPFEAEPDRGRETLHANGARERTHVPP